MARAKLYEGNFGDQKFKGQADLIVKSLARRQPQTAQEIAADIKADLTTRQDPIRVVSFYMSTWKKSGLVKVVGTAEAPVSTGASNSAPLVADNGRELEVLTPADVADFNELVDAVAEESVEELPELELPVIDWQTASLKDAVLTMLARFEESTATPADIADELTAVGRPTNKNQVRDTLGKLGKSGHVVKADAGAFSLSNEAANA